jgi:hypothetical protein
MNTATMISQREKLLPPLQKREWALRKQRFELKTSTGFHDFLQLLLEEKNADQDVETFLRSRYPPLSQPLMLHHLDIA